MGAIDKAGAAIGGYAGVWIDQAAGGVLHIQLVNPTDAVTSVFRPLLGEEEPVFDRVVHPMKSLQETAEVVRNYNRSNAVFRKALISSGVDSKQNIVAVTLHEGTDPQIAEDLYTKTGRDNVRVTYSKASFFAESRNRPNTTPLFGGQWTQLCTVGYSNAISNRGQGGRVMITAGHCRPDPVNFLFYQGLVGPAGQRPSGLPIGAEVFNAGFPDRDISNCDCQSIGVLTSNLPTNRVLINDTATFAYGSTANPANYAVGAKTCLSGANYGDVNGGAIACGTITVSSMNIRYLKGMYTLEDAAITSIAGTSGGDSGGPYGNGGAFMGVHAAGYGIESAGVSAATALSKSTNFNEAMLLRLSY